MGEYPTASSTRAAAAAAVALLALGSAGVARAAVPDTYGVGSASVGRAGSAGATANGFEALHYNPAGLAETPGARFSLAAHGHGSLLRANDAPVSLREPFGYALGAVAPLPLGGVLAGRVTVGLLVYMLPADLLVAELRLPEEAFFLLYDDAGGRAAVEMGLAFEILEGLSVGLALDVFAGLDGFAGAREGAARSIDATIAVVTPVAAKIHAGVRWRPAFLPALSLGFTYRSVFDLSVRLDARTDTGGLPIDLVTTATVFFVPETWTLSAAFDVARRVTLSLDASYRRWSRLDTPFVTVDADLVDAIALAADPPRANLRDVPDVRAGIEGRLPLPGAASLAVRAGYAIEPTPVPAQTGATNLLDSTHHVVAAGATLAFPRVAGRPLSIGLHVAAHVLPMRTHVKDATLRCAEGGVCDSDTMTAGFQTDNPGWPEMRAGGAILTGGLTLELGL